MTALRSELRLPAFRTLCARDELSLPLLAAELVPELMRLGLAPVDAEAVAANTVSVYLAVEWRVKPAHASALLELYSLAEIADLREAYRAFQDGVLEYGENERYEEECG